MGSILSAQFSQAPTVRVWGSGSRAWATLALNPVKPVHPLGLRVQGPFALRTPYPPFLRDCGKAVCIGLRVQVASR